MSKKESKEIVVAPERVLDVAAPIAEVLAQVQAIQQLMAAVMKQDVHYGVIPGCGDKPTLLKPGAEKLCFTFRLRPTYKISTDILGNGHKEFQVVCTLRNQADEIVSQGVGICSTLESKYRYRRGAPVSTGKPCPKEYWDCRKSNPEKAQTLIGGKGHSVKKDENNQWMIFKGSSEKVENPDIADCFNTCLKIAKKRALVDATITGTAASDIFAQDLEDLPEDLKSGAPARKPDVEVKKEPAKTPQSDDEILAAIKAKAATTQEDDVAWE